MTFIKFGFRSLFRQKRRTSITLLVIVFGIGSLLLATGHSRFIGWGLRESTIHADTGHLQVFHRQYFEQDEETILEYGLEDYERMRADFIGLPEVREVLARIELMGLLSNGEKSVACIGQGVEPEKEAKMRALGGLSSVMYDPFLSQSDAEIIALGNGLADSLNVNQGDYVTLMTTTAEGALNALDLRVVGTFSGFSPEYDARAIVLPLKTAQMLLNTSKVKNLVVTLEGTAKTDMLFDEISRLSEENGYPVVLRKWHEQAFYYKKVRQFYKQLTGFLSLALFILVFFSTSNTIVMAILERTREIGT
ncbi:MAG: ABC transporter permease, partial [Candidatus Aminicenantes bacterium]|nr:ABC transporter permease [Candidatus Aminicenantes bacterium]